MNDSPTTVESAPARAQVHPTRSPFWKEFRESRGVLVVGLVGFFAVPAVLEMVSIWTDRRHETTPMAWVLLWIVGWLYGILVGAHVVCRDWGQSEERFLLALPASPRTIVWAKLLAAIVVLLWVVVASATWDLVLAMTGRIAGDTEFWIVARFVTLAFCATAIGFAIAFASGVVTRQMLASTLIAILSLLIWAIAPQLSSRLIFLHPRWLSGIDLWAQSLSTGQRMHTLWQDFGWPFLTATVLAVIGCIAGALVYSKRESVVRLQFKQIAWVFAVILMAFFALAITEVGNAVRIRSQTVLFESKYAVPSQYGPQYNIFMTQQGDRFIAVCAPGSRVFALISFRVDAQGQVRDLRRADYPHSDSSKGMLDRLAGFGADKEGHLVLMGWRHEPDVPTESTKERWKFKCFWRTTLEWTETSEPRILSESTVTPRGGLRGKMSPYSLFRRHAALDRYLYLVGATSTDTNAPSYAVEVYDWTESPTPKSRYQIPLPLEPGAELRQVYIGKGGLSICYHPDSRSKKPGPSGVLIGQFDLGYPEALLDKRTWSVRPFGSQNWYSGYNKFEEFTRVHGGEMMWDMQDDRAYLSDRRGLRILGKSEPQGWKVIGEYGVLPLQMLTRSWVMPMALDESLVVEYGSGLVLYDTSQPARPRRLGFINSGYFDTLNRGIFATPQHIVTCGDNEVTVFDRPR